MGVLAEVVGVGRHAVSRDRTSRRVADVLEPDGYRTCAKLSGSGREGGVLLTFLARKQPV